MSLTVTVLGSSGSHAAPGNPCTGLLLTAEGSNVLLDCGPGVLGPLQEHVALAAVDAVVVTHHDRASVGGVHSSTLGAGEAARRTAAGRLVLTYLAPGSDVAAFEAEAADAYGSPVHAAQPGDVLIP